jgi:predicted PurR-regulated permease PerM
LRDRFIRIAGGTDIRLTTLAINDAGERLSRFFVSQFAVNLGSGLIRLDRAQLIGLPHPLLWAALAAVLRFVPYVGCGSRRCARFCWRPPSIRAGRWPSMTWACSSSSS